MNTLMSPCSYQGGKQRLAKDIVDIFYSENQINEDTKFFDICCGSGAIALELINRGVNPNNITMVDKGVYGAFWNSVANEEFSVEQFQKEVNKLPSIENIQKYLQELSSKEVDKERFVYHYLLLQAGAFGSKQLWIKDDKWMNCSFRSFWQPTETSNRRSHVNPMMPMPDTLFNRVTDIVKELSGCIRGIYSDIFKCLHIFDELKDNNAIIYIDPPYKNTTAYGDNFDIYELVNSIHNNVSIYVSEGFKMDGIRDSHLLSTGRKKGNISGDVKKKPVEEWLNKYVA